MSSDFVVRPQSRFDFNCYRAFRDAYEPALESKEVKRILVDLKEVQYMDSAALGILLLLRDRAKAVSKEVELVNTSGAVREVLEIANFPKVFKIS